MNNPIIEVKDLYKTYYNGNIPLEVLRGIDLTVDKGEIVSIVGESGCGKSTFLNVVGGLDSTTSGQILINQERIDEMSENDLSYFRNRNIGFVFQFHHLLPDFTAIENVMLPYLTHQFDRKKASQLAMEILHQVKLDKRADHRPNQLSGGEQQRIAIARAIINNPGIIFADEPTGNLDEKTSHEIQELLWNLREKFQLTILLVTHNKQIAEQADRKVTLSYGKIERD